VKILARRQHVLKMPRVAMQWRGDDHGVNILAVEQLTMIAVSFDVRRNLLRLIEAALVDVSDRDEFGVRRFAELFHQLLSAPARPDDAEPHAVIRAGNAAVRAGG